MLILGIESTCDETAAAVVADGRTILSNIVASQHELHRPFGGVVPEVAARAHAERITALIDEAVKTAGIELSQIDGISVVNRPGLVGALLVGISAAKGLALALNKPLIGIDHILGHVYAATLAGMTVYPHISLIVSGGHTCLYIARSPTEIETLGHTMDDAAGEAFDKVAKLLKLGFPGGPALARCALNGNPHAIHFPRCGPSEKLTDRLLFSFSGLKTAVYYHLREQKTGPFEKGKGKTTLRQIDERERADIAASFQEAACEILVAKTLEAARRNKLRQIAIGGGVACNKRLREMFAASVKDCEVFFPPPELCGDNAAMSAGLAYHFLANGIQDNLYLDVDPTPKRVK